MKNYIENSHTKTILSLTESSINSLKQYAPKGCPFKEYTLFDLLSDFVNMYSWKITGTKTIKEFVRLLQNEGYEKAMIYGNAIIEVIEE